ncbi:MAG: hypothetical protein AAF938_19365, partial [Myxococcota bacterium]
MEERSNGTPSRSPRLVRALFAPQNWALLGVALTAVPLLWVCLRDPNFVPDVIGDCGSAAAALFAFLASIIALLVVVDRSFKHLERRLPSLIIPALVPPVLACLIGSEVPTLRPSAHVLIRPEVISLSRAQTALTIASGASTLLLLAAAWALAVRAFSRRSRWSGNVFIMTLAVWAVGVWALFSWLPEWECTGYFVAAICTLFAALTAFTNACVGPRVPARVPQVMPLLSAAGCALAACAQVGLSMGELWRVGAHASRADMYEGLVGTWELVLRGLQVDLSSDAPKFTHAQSHLRTRREGAT